jgi:hypothetical protein
LTLESALIRSFSLGALKDDLADPDAGLEDKRKRSQVSDLKHLAIINSGLNESCGHMNDQAHSSKPAPPFEPTTNIPR